MSDRDILPGPATGLVPTVEASPDKLALRRFLRNPAAVAGTIALVIVVVVTLIGPIISPFEPTAIDLTQVRKPPSGEHLLGTDSTGRDVFSRLLAGGQISLLVGFSAALVAVAFGTLAGVVAGWFGGIVDAIISRIIDIMLSVPAVLVIIVLAGVIGPSVPMLIIVIAGLAWPNPARIARGVVLSLREEEFVQAARAIGSRTRFILARHLVPGALPPIVVSATLLVAESVLLESSLSFLGAGVQPPQSSWGNMLNEAQSLTVLSSMPWLWVPPGLMIAVIVLSAMAIGDGIRDAIDPRKN
ncbi:oligopeptide ABC transporter permease [Parenemella sanctibonifatiensis]|uniref:oligopeptide ABC transporter permease n=1 Tax=Parenemella sanctibonifatiensis TaxID=2016505 RepID=UPI0015C668C9|nr:oligopeptide ABC transporter permease [Parenemella sanctibonifatiensis]